MRMDEYDSYEVSVKLVKALSANRTSTNGAYDVVRFVLSLHGGVRIVLGTIRIL